MSTGAALIEIFAQSKAVRRAILSKQDCSPSFIVFFLELPGAGGEALASWVEFWKENVVIFSEKKEEKGAVTQEEGMKDDVGPRGTQFHLVL